MIFRRFFLVFHTLRFLRVRQLLYQIYYRLRPLVVREVAHAEPRGVLDGWSGLSYQHASTSDGRVFDFLGCTAAIENDWNCTQHSKLWLYNLHYLDNLNSIEADDFRSLNEQLLDEWIRCNPPAKGNGWEPYPLALRIVNLVKWFARQRRLKPYWIASLATQARALAARCEYHILGNHLFVNGKALTFAGVYLKGKEADRVLKLGLRILDKEISEQFMVDGAHFELSPMYHALMLWDMCDLVALARSSGIPELLDRQEQWCAVIRQGVEWLRSMVHPDGEISFFNDAAFGIAPTLAQLESYAALLDCLPDQEGEQRTGGWVVVANGASGYVTVDCFNERHRAILDVAKIGSDYQPGHAHADTLSFELSLFGYRVFVNSGTSKYGEDGERLRQRSTAAHNTVEVDGQNSSEVWAGFRVGRRAKVFGQKVRSDHGCVSVSASHNGYMRLPGKVIHTRRWSFTPGAIHIKDSIDGKFSAAVARFYCHPAVFVSQLDENTVILTLPNGKQIRVSFKGSRSLAIARGTWHPRFGMSEENQYIRVEPSSHSLCTKIEWDSI